MNRLFIRSVLKLIFLVGSVGIAQQQSGSGQQPTATAPQAGNSTDMQKQYENVFKAEQEEMKRFHFSNKIHKWGDTLVITYTLPETSPFISPENHDTLFCVVGLDRMGEKRTLVLQMKRVNDTTRSASFVIPDSTYSFSANLYTTKTKVTGKKFGSSNPCVNREGKGLANPLNTEVAVSIPMFETDLRENLKRIPWISRAWQTCSKISNRCAMMGMIPNGYVDSSRFTAMRGTASKRKVRRQNFNGLCGCVPSRLMPFSVHCTRKYWIASKRHEKTHRGNFWFWQSYIRSHAPVILFLECISNAPRTPLNIIPHTTRISSGSGFVVCQKKSAWYAGLYSMASAARLRYIRERESPARESEYNFAKTKNFPGVFSRDASTLSNTSLYNARRMASASTVHIHINR